MEEKDILVCMNLLFGVRREVSFCDIARIKSGNGTQYYAHTSS